MRSIEISKSSIEILIDELEVRRVLDEYCLRLEANQFADWLELFTEDTVYEVYKLILRGRQELNEVLSKAPHGTHLGGPSRITITKDRAETLQSYLFVATNANEWNTGWYDRTLVRTDLGWKIAHTRVKIGRKDSLPTNERAAQIDYPVSFGKA
jgi:hypothetical protein